MNHIIQLLNIADDKITVGEFKAVANRMFPSPDAWKSADVTAMTAPTSARQVVKAKPKTPRASKPRAEKAPSAEVEALLGSVLNCLAKDGAGQNVVTIGDTLDQTGVTATSREIKRALDVGIERNVIRREGHKRATKYFLV